MKNKSKPTMKTFVSTESLEPSAEYISLQVVAPSLNRKKPLRLQVNWIRSSRRFANGNGIAWVRKNQPDAEATIRDEVEAIERLLL
ncbi:hypothetical protein [Pontiella sulfatireligans]|uniref:Uncharacterized protein n=1 Tax=Pontiella sulfatireligans TaxID=2750658 RepID=A0A6C2USF3_9BACT|nr:hypothetical protein [Pontiella sulfatireligans]VGO23188.1 hypothetical protein SCARR_05293 [Pontiella sulfatireligans]